jgi:membrane protease YdiL (CAAX protease family)
MWSIVHLPAYLICTGQIVSRDPTAMVRLLLLAPLLEEWVLRAGLQEWLIRRMARLTPRNPAHVGVWADLAPATCSAGAFALMHLGSGWRAVGLVLAPGLAMAVLYQQTRDWRLCMLLHGAMNAFAIGACAI